MKITRLLDPVAPAGGAPTVAAPAPTQVTGTGFQPAPNVEETVVGPDPFLADDNKPNPEAVPVNEPVVKPAGDTVVVDPNKPVVPAVVAPAPYTAEQVAALLKAGATPVAPAPVIPPKALTPEEIDTQLNTFKPTAEMLNDLGLDGANPKVVENFSKMASALVKNAVTVATILAQEQVRAIRAEYEPHVRFAQEQQQVYAQQQYFADNPNHVGLEPLIGQVAMQMEKEGTWKGKSPTETFKEVGKRVNDLVTRLKIPVPAPGAAPVVPAPGEVVKPASTRMSTVSSGGQGGAGGAGGGDKGKDPEAGIWS